MKLTLGENKFESSEPTEYRIGPAIVKKGSYDALVERLRVTHQCTAGFNSTTWDPEDHNLLNEAADLLEAQERELQEARKDAERYQWLCVEQPNLDVDQLKWDFASGRTKAEIDVAIDAFLSRRGAG